MSDTPGKDEKTTAANGDEKKVDGEEIEKPVEPVLSVEDGNAPSEI